MIAGMAGFTLPKLRWLVAGAVAAGFWAMTQEPPSRQRADAPRPKAPVQRQAALPATPGKAIAPKPRPSPMVTSSIPRPEKPVGKDPAKPSLVTTTRVHLRAKAGISAAIVSTLKPGQTVGLLARDGKWRLVSAAGQKGWVHGDYLGAEAKAAKARASAAPPPTQPVSGRSAISKAKNFFLGSWRPARVPQGGNCQCPYDLMLNGKQCGDKSAYGRRGERSIQCYL